MLIEDELMRTCWEQRAIRAVGFIVLIGIIVLRDRWQPSYWVQE